MQEASFTMKTVGNLLVRSALPLGASKQIPYSVSEDGWLVEFNDIVERTVAGLNGLGSAVAKGDDSHNSLVLRNVEELAQLVGIAHTHDERIEAHSTSLQHKVAVGEAVVVGAPSVAHLIGGIALEEARLAALKG